MQREKVKNQYSLYLQGTNKTNTANKLRWEGEPERLQTKEINRTKHL